MKLTAQIKLLPSPEQVLSLKSTIETANAACNWISEQAWEQQIFGQYNLHHICYYSVREQFGLSAQMTVRCIAKVSDAYGLDNKKKVMRQFQPHGSIPYDYQLVKYYTKKDLVSIRVLSGRIKVPFVCGQRQRRMLEHQQGQSDLAYVDGCFYLLACCNIVDPPEEDAKEYLGVDLGITNIAADSDGEVFSGSTIKAVRHRCARLRAKLQAKGTKSAKRLLKRRRRTEARFAKDVNHCISKKLVAKAQDTKRGIALEDLKGITERTTVCRAQRRCQHSWSFSQLRSFIEYKAKMMGVKVIAVDPRNTSRTCPACGCVSKLNRPSQAKFCCIQCGFSGFADAIAAGNIARRAAVNQPYAEAAG